MGASESTSTSGKIEEENRDDYRLTIEIANKKRIEDMERKMDTIINLLKNSPESITNQNHRELDGKFSNFPLSEISQIEDFEEQIRDKQTEEDFKQFLISLGGSNVNFTSANKIIPEVYDLKLQKAITYNRQGEKKYEMNGLKQTEIILDVMEAQSERTLGECEADYKDYLERAGGRLNLL